MLSREEATQILDGILETVRNEWQPALRRTGVSELECERLSRAFVYEGLFYFVVHPSQESQTGGKKRHRGGNHRSTSGLASFDCLLVRLYLPQARAQE
jgi:hypothetical protein